jgi:hypothetical protein
MKLAVAVLAAIIAPAGVRGRCGSSDIPTDGTNAIQTIRFYDNDSGGSEGDDCPSSCDGTAIKTQLYAIADQDDDCFQWPGRSGDNAMKSGTCNTGDSSYSYDQWTNCECIGGVGASKEVFTSKCVVDTTPTTLCAKITDYTACTPPDEQCKTSRRCSDLVVTLAASGS